ncbi:MAG: hypothetical protein Q8Q09_24230 [Deltaproteobacteria bacterium]|nr:hypothetical protein [Deltaproteobacteria bacterium]
MRSWFGLAMCASTVLGALLAGGQTRGSGAGRVVRLQAIPLAIPGRAMTAGQARIVILHLAHGERARSLSVWSSLPGRAPWTTGLAYGQVASIDVAPGSQGFAARFEGMQPPTAERLGSNTGAGTLEAAKVYFVFATGAVGDRVDNRIERASVQTIPAGQALIRVLGAWPAQRTMDVCAVRPEGERAIAQGLGGRGFFGSAAARPGQARESYFETTAGQVLTLAVHLSQGPACAGPLRKRFRLMPSRATRHAVFLYGDGEAEFSAVVCNEESGGCVSAMVDSGP